MDDQVLWRRGIACLLRDCREFGLAHEAATVSELARAPRWLEQPPDVVIAGPGLARCTETLVRELRPYCAANRLLAMIGPDAEPAAALKAGALGYSTVSTMSSLDEFLLAIRKVSTARRYLCPHLVRRLEDRAEGGNRARELGSLSTREMEVLLGLLKGRRLKEIAGEMDVTQKSVHSYRTRMMTKLGLKNITDVVRYALYCGLLDPKPDVPPSAIRPDAPGV